MFCLLTFHVFQHQKICSWKRNLSLPIWLMRVANWRVNFACLQFANFRTFLTCTHILWTILWVYFWGNLRNFGYKKNLCINLFLVFIELRGKWKNFWWTFFCQIYSLNEVFSRDFIAIYEIRYFDYFWTYCAEAFVRSRLCVLLIQQKREREKISKTHMWKSIFRKDHQSLLC